jgi:HTH-type transcriptional regulator/antitoxin HigA
MGTNIIIPHKATHPGALLKDELQARELSQKEFANDIEMQPTMLNEIIKGKRAITAEIALILEKALDLPAEFWLNFQTQFELDQARIKDKLINKTQQIEIWKLIKQYVPVSIFMNQGMLTSSLSNNIAKVWDIYEVQTIDELVGTVSIHKNSNFYKKSEKLKNDQINIFAWSKLAEWHTKSITVNQFHPEKKDAIKSELNTVFYRNQNVVEGTTHILNKYGIKFGVIERFKQSPIDGYSFWSNENPAIMVTLRKKILDNLAFTIMHELGHIFIHLLPNHEESFLDIEYPNSELNEKEQEAHSFARNCFIDNATWREFFEKNPIYNYSTTETQIKKLALRLQIHPSIVFGRYCFETGQFAIKTGIDRTIK